MTRSQSLQLMSEIVAAFPRQALTQNTISLYCAHLMRFDFHRGLVGVRGLIATARFFPALGELIATLDSRLSSSAAWAELLSEIRVSSDMRSSSLDPLVRTVVDELGGFARFARLKSDSIVSERARFMELYQQRLLETRVENFALEPHEEPLKIHGDTAHLARMHASETDGVS